MANYTDLIMTNFPNSLDDRPDAIEEANRNDHFKVNVNFGSRDPFTPAIDYVVLAEDVNALQESIIAVQRSLGTMPQGMDLNYTVDERIQDIETYTLMDDSSTNGYANLDERYIWGGTRPLVNSEPAPLISIKGHYHDGSPGQANKIDLAQHITGTLSKTYLDLDSGTPSMLSAQDIRMSEVSTETIPEVLETKFSKDGGTIDGNVVVVGSFKSLTHIELEAIDTYYDTGKGFSQATGDNYAFSGYCRRGLMSNSAGTLLRSEEVLRYGKYVAAFRMKVSDNLSGQIICYLSILNSILDSRIEEVSIRASDFDAPNEYKTFYLEFDHKNLYGSSTRAYIVPEVEFIPNIADLSIDSVVITPITTAVYDDDIY